MKRKHLGGVLKKVEIMIDYISAAGEDLASEPSDTMSEGPGARHHLLRHKLTLDEGPSSDKAAAEGEEEGEENESKRGARKKQQSCKDASDIGNSPVQAECTRFALTSDFDFCQADSESDGYSTELFPEDDGMSEELSQSEDEFDDDGPKRCVSISCQ